MYTIEVKDNSKERVIVICPSLISVKEWIYSQLLRAMREDVAMNVTLATMREIVAHYDTQLINLDDFDEEVGVNSFTAYCDTRYVVKYSPDENLNLVNVI